MLLGSVIVVACGRNTFFVLLFLAPLFFIIFNLVRTILTACTRYYDTPRGYKNSTQ